MRIMEKNKKITVFILTYKRPSNVKTYETLHTHGFSGDIYLVVSSDDPTLPEYKKNYGKDVIVFDKGKTRKSFDMCDNKKDLIGSVFPRNEIWQIAKNMGVDQFIELDDDYTRFNYKANANFCYVEKKIKSINKVFSAMLLFQKNTNCHALAMAQGGDFVGGKNSGAGKTLVLKRKAMNAYAVSSLAPFEWIGRMNEDVNSYVLHGSRGLLFFTNTHVEVKQAQTQAQAGGLTEMYSGAGTYVKSFYSIMIAPSCVKISMIGYSNRRIHHEIKWNNAVPKILSEIYCKKD